MVRKELQERMDELALAVATLRRDVDETAPATEVERIDAALHALGDLRELIANRAPFSEVARLDGAFVGVAQLETDLAQLRDHVGARLDALTARIEALEARPEYDPSAYAPSSEIARLDHAFDELAARAPFSEIARLDLAFSEVAAVRESIESGIRSERAVEIPWIVGRYRGEADVLEVGIANAEERYLAALAGLAIPHLVGLDLASAPDRAHDVAEVHQGDVRDVATFPAASFDLILCVSTLGHIGRDNTVYGLDGPVGEGGDLQALTAMATWLREDGRLLLTVPFGRFEDQGWLVNYDAATLAGIVAAAGLEVIDAEHHELRGAWQRVDVEAVAHRGYRTMGAPHAGAVALLELRKR